MLELFGILLTGLAVMTITGVVSLLVIHQLDKMDRRDAEKKKKVRRSKTCKR